MFGPIPARDKDEPNRASTPLELFYDLATVVAIAAAATGLHHAIAEGEALIGISRFIIIFFAIWWSWMSFTWLASAHDASDASYVVCVFVLIFGTCVLAAGVQHFFETGENHFGVIGWTLQRIALVMLWFRAARGGTRTAANFAIGLSALQTGWVITLVLVPEPLRTWLSAALLASELLLPIFAGKLNWHRTHIVERYGLLTLIVLGEGVASIATILAKSFEGGQTGVSIASTSLAATLIICTMWWLYFRENEGARVVRGDKLIVWAYGHALVFAPAAAVGAGLAVWSELANAHGEEALDPALATWSVAIPLALFLVGLNQALCEGKLRRSAFAATGICVLVAPLMWASLWPIAVALLALVAWLSNSNLPAGN